MGQDDGRVDMMSADEGTAEGGSEGLRIKTVHVQAFVLSAMVAIVIIWCASTLMVTTEGDGLGPLATDGSGSRASAGDDPCVKCHSNSDVMPGVMEDWASSKHADNNVSCIDCHEGEESEPDTVKHNGYWVSAIVSPLDCAECHPDEVAENARSLHALGTDYYELLFKKKVLPYLESQIDDGYIMRDGENMTHAATIRGCQACHGTNMTGKTVDDWTEWPNNGIGRINPDGSKGSCSACHSRHRFSVEEARKPETCGQCHLGPDHPQIEMYLESKHGNIYSSEGDTWNWTSEDWEAGKDYRAPTCAVCHMSAAPGVPVTHDVGHRLSWELEPAISKRTDNTANSLGWTIGDGSTWQEKQARMMKVCGQCHGETWVDNYYEQADLAVELYNQQYTDVKATVDALYEDGLLTPDPFDEPIEFKIYEFWHHEGRRARMGSFMQGPDYVQWHGFYELLQDRVEIEDMAEDIRAKAEAENGNGDDDDDDDDDEIGLWQASAVLLLALILVVLLVHLVASRKEPPSSEE